MPSKIPKVNKNLIFILFIKMYRKLYRLHSKTNIIPYQELVIKLGDYEWLFDCKEYLDGYWKAVNKMNVCLLSLALKEF